MTSSAVAHPSGELAAPNPLPPALQVDAAVAKIGKYAVSESGDTVEIIERPRGGISIVVADGQRSGASAKAISNLAVRKAVTLIGEGVRDGAVARATHDYLQAVRVGKVSAEFTIVSVDLVTRTLVISRNGRCPSLLRRGNDWSWLDDPSEAIGIHLNTKPTISQFDLAPGMTLVVFSDGVWAAGVRKGIQLDLVDLLNRIDAGGDLPAQAVAGAILDEALRLDDQRPHDDATVVVVKLMPRSEENLPRRLTMQFPV
jgi:serine phosphatase RsbU (regulator of sigma subunit)